jgi:hypothetical protein
LTSSGISAEVRRINSSRENGSAFITQKLKVRKSQVNLDTGWVAQASGLLFPASRRKPLQTHETRHLNNPLQLFVPRRNSAGRRI